MGDAAPSWDAGREQWQEIRNGRPIPAREQQRRLAPPVPVTAWVFWERDGLELVDTVAAHFAGRDVLVELRDGRQQLHGVWLAAQDARRR